MENMAIIYITCCLINMLLDQHVVSSSKIHMIQLVLHHSNKFMDLISMIKQKFVNTLNMKEIHINMCNAIDNRGFIYLCNQFLSLSLQYCKIDV